MKMNWKKILINVFSVVFTFAIAWLLLKSIEEGLNYILKIKHGTYIAKQDFADFKKFVLLILVWQTWRHYDANPKK